ncbi:hypothetical protein BH09VER1_BH09VER1_28320 [soil metagenome]
MSGEYIVKIGSVGDDSGVTKMEEALGRIGSSATKAGGLVQDAAGRWRQATGQFATDTQKAAAGVETLGKKSVDATNKSAAAFKQADEAANNFINSIKMGVGIDIGGRMVSSIAAIPRLLTDAISKGVEFNAKMQNADVGIQNVLSRFMDLDAVAAKREAAAAMQQIVDLEPKAAGGLSDLVQGFMATVASAQGVGITVSQNIDLVGRFANALQNANLPIEQLGQEMRSILSGNITADSSIAKILNISNADIAKAREAGNLYQYLVGTIGKLGEAGDSEAVRLSTFNSALEKALGRITKPVFDVFMDGLLEMTDAINKGNPSLDRMGEQIAALVKEGIGWSKWATENAGLMLTLGKTVGVFVAAWAAFQVAALIVGLNRKALAILANKAALDAETASLIRNEAAQTANAATRAAVTTAATAEATAAAASGGAAAATTGKVAAGVGRAAPLLTTGSVLAGAGAAYSLYQLWNSFKDTNVGLSQGGKSSEGDRDAAAAMRNKNQAELMELVKSIQNVKSAPERDALRLQLSKMIQDTVSKQREAKPWEEGRTAQNTALGDHAQSLTQLLQVLAGKGNLLSASEVAAQAAAKKAQAEAEAKAAEDAVKNAQILDDYRTKAAEKDRKRDASTGIDLAKKQMDGGNTAGADQSLANQEAFYRDWLSRARAEQPQKNGDDLKANLSMQEELQGYLEKIAEARQDLPAAIAKADEEAKKKQIKDLEDQKALVEAQGKDRLAAVEAEGKSARDLALARKAIEDDVEAKRLELENKIGALQDETALKREARAVEFHAAELGRSNALQATLATNDGISGTKGGELFKGTNRRRGVATSDTFEQPIDVLNGAQPLTDFGAATAQRGAAGAGLIPPASVPPAIATPGAAGVGGATPVAGSTPAAGGSSSGQSVSEDTGKVADGVKELQQTLSQGLKEVSAALKAAAGTTKKDLADLKVRVKALEDE